jgi:phage replication-related protein YjqB (UPF0714/DUF867 family)
MLHTPPRAPGTVTGVAFAELLAHPDVVEELTLGSRAGFLALHGGLEPGTAEIAREAAARAGASCYSVVQPRELKRHVPSHEADAASSRRLEQFLRHVDVVISVHGYWGRDALHRAVLVGGADRTRAARLAVQLRAALPDYRIVDDLAAIPRRLRGLDPRNPVNQGRAGGTPVGGVQVELPHPVRALGPYGYGADGELHRAHTEALVGALAEFARSAATASEAWRTEP